MPDGFSPPLPTSQLRRTAQSDQLSPVTYGNPAASGASDTGYDSLNRKRRKQKPYPGVSKPMLAAPGPSNPPPLQAPRVTPISPSVAGTVEGQPPRRRLRVDDDPFGQAGNYVGSFLVKSAVELSGGYESNPGRFEQPRGSSFYMIAPELQATSDWTRHSVSVDLRGSFTGYGETFPSDASTCSSSGCSPGVSPVPVNVDRPEFTGKVDGRLDVTRDTRLTSEARLHIGTDNPGSPNVQAGLSKYPLYATLGGSAGIEQDFNRFQLQVNGNIDRTVYQFSQLTDGTSSSNDDRNFNQYGAQARLSYDLKPGLKPFAEVETDTRVHDLNFDRNGFQRDSNGGYVKAGTTFEFSRLLTGEVAAGWSWRDYQDPHLRRLDGLLTSASLVWTATGLTTVRLTATSSIDETTLADVSGSLSRDYVIEVDHAFRRWLLGTAKVGYGTTDYQGARFDNRYFIEGNLIYKLTRTVAIKASVRHDWLTTDAIGSNSRDTIVMLGVRVQR